MKDYSERLVSFNQVSPTFFIGLGGSGSDVVNRISGKLRDRWNWKTLEQLIHFFAVDTNTHDLSKQDHVPRDNRILISDFDKRAFVDQKRGRGYQDEDEFVTQWVHDWYEFRGTRGAGAGQIRIESRLSLYYQLEQDRGRIVQRLTTAMNTARDHDNPYRKSHPPHFNVFIYGSIAGGTGSGSFIPMAYLVKELIEQQGWIPKVYGTLILPSLFLNDVPGPLHRDINSNGYAALKELEHLMKLGAEGAATQTEFHYNPNNPHEPLVRDKPFSFVYLADKPSTFEIPQYKNAIADAAYLLLYSPILGAQASDYDNYEKHQKGLVSGYTVYYGSNGCSVLLLPDKDILQYCAMRFAAKAMGDYLLFQRRTADGSDFAINFNDPKFQRLSKQGQAEAIDGKFVQFVEYEARREAEDEIENGPYQAVASLKTPTGGSLLTELEALVDDFASRCQEAITLDTVRSSDIVEQNIKVDQELNDLRNEVNASRTQARSIADAARQEIKNGLVIRNFFQTHSANPYTQRFFLIRAKDVLRQQIDELEARVSGIRDEVDLGGDQVTSQMKDWRDRLTETAEWTLMERVKRNNEDFEHAKSGFINYFNGTLVDGNRTLIVSEFKLQWLREMLDHVEKRLDSFRLVATQAVDAIEALNREAEEARQSGRFAQGPGRSNAFILDVEALHEVGGERLWNLFFDDRFVAEGREFNYFDEAAIFEIITEAFNPKLDETGRRVAKSAREITDEISQRLIELGNDTLGPDIVGSRTGGTDMSQKGLLLDDALFYEARYHFRRQFAEDGRPEDEPSDAQLIDYLKSKFRFANSKSHALATFDNNEDLRVINSVSALVGVHDAYRDRLAPMLDEVVPDAQRIPHWFDEKSMVFYRANLGIPLYFYKRVNGEMRRDYVLAREKPPTERGYPLHIESGWEDGLPDLDPVDHKKTEDGAIDHTQALIDFSIGFAIGVFREQDGKVHWHIGTFGDVLGDDRVAALAALGRLDERTRRRIESAIKQARRALTETDPAVLGQLDAHLKDLDELVWTLEQRKDPAQGGLLAFVKEEEQTLKQWRESLS